MQTVAKFQVEGTLLDVGTIQTFQSGFQKRQLVIETSSKPDKWTHPVAVTLTKDRVGLADSLKPGVFVRTDGFIDGREWEKDGQKRYFTDLVVKSILTVAADGTNQEVTAPAQASNGDEPVDPEMPF